MAAVKITGLAEFRQALKAADGKLDQALRSALMAAIGPMIADARSRFAALPGAVPNRTAAEVGGSVTQKAISLVLRQQFGFELAREFGANGPRTTTFTQRRPGGAVTVTRTLNYASPRLFGPHVRAGNAFYPAATKGVGLAQARIWAALGEIADKLGGS